MGDSFLGGQNAGILHNHSIHFHRTRCTHLRRRTCSTPTTTSSLDTPRNHHRTRCCRPYRTHFGRHRILPHSSEQAQQEEQAPTASHSLGPSEPFVIFVAAKGDGEEHVTRGCFVNHNQPAYLASSTICAIILSPRSFGYDSLLHQRHFKSYFRSRATGHYTAQSHECNFAKPVGVLEDNCDEQGWRWAYQASR